MNIAGTALIADAASLPLRNVAGHEPPDLPALVKTHEHEDVRLASNKSKVTDVSPVRILRILPSKIESHSSTSEKSQRTTTQGLTKRQRQNAAKRAKAQAAKAESEALQALALKRHVKDREAARLASSFQLAKMSTQPEMSNMSDTDWKTIPRSRTSCDKRLPLDTTERFIWDEKVS